MVLEPGLIGVPFPAHRVVVGRSPVERSATAVSDDDPLSFDADWIRGAGFRAMPTPPTFASVMAWWGAFRELQEPGPARRRGAAALQQMRADTGGMILHGEEEFLYHRGFGAGDELVGTGRVVDAYQCESDDRALTFCVSEVQWRDARSDELVVTVRSTLLHRGPRTTPP